MEATAASDVPAESSAEHSERPIGPLRRMIRRVGIELAVFSVLYVLSIGPMFWYWYDAYYLGGPTWIARLYTPLLLLTRIEIIRDVLNWYIGLWIA